MVKFVVLITDFLITSFCLLLHTDTSHAFSLQVHRYQNHWLMIIYTRIKIFMVFYINYSIIHWSNKKLFINKFKNQMKNVNRRKYCSRTNLTHFSDLFSDGKNIPVLHAQSLAQSIVVKSDFPELNFDKRYHFNIISNVEVLSGRNVFFASLTLLYWI